MNVVSSWFNIIVDFFVIMVPLEDTKEDKGIGRFLKECAEAFIIAMLITTFIRGFVVEIYKIPTGSMIPTLIGGLIAEKDVNNDGKDDLIVLSDNHYRNQGNPQYVFLKNHSWYEKIPRLATEFLSVEPLKGKYEYDKILVNKFVYWFSKPKRGDIVVFKVPQSIYSSDKPFYIKRIVGLPGENLQIFDGSIYINGEEVQEPLRISEIYYENDYQFSEDVVKTIPDNEYYLFGDNSGNSYDSRKWGGITINQIKGKAFLRYWSFKKLNFVK